MTEAQRSYSVLLVEDNSELLDILIHALRDIGHFTTYGAADGVIGLTKFYEVRPDCVVIDVKMPGINGYQLVRAIRGDPETASTPLVILTALSQEKEQFAGMAAGVDVYLTKPISPQDLIRAILTTFTMSDAEREQRLRTLAEESE